MPQFSIIVPVYNVQNYLAACVKSVAEQPGPRDWECILVDDGSTDSSGQICDVLAAEIPGLRVLHQQNGGLANARNTGLARAVGRWVLFVDCDDCLLPDAVETLLAAQARTGADIVQGGWQYCDEADTRGAVQQYAEACYTGPRRLDVVELPTNKPLARVDLPDAVYKTQKGKYAAILDIIAECYSRRQPILVGTTSIEKSEMISKLLKARGIPHEVLNAKFHEKEAEIVAQAGKPGAVTISTNMAGRGTDIMLGGNAEYLAKDALRREGMEEDLIYEATAYGETQDETILAARAHFQELLKKYKAEIAPEAEKVRSVGGLYILGTERHESRRIDNQLRGRAGRQGDPGTTKFVISLEDDLMRLFGGERLQALMNSMGVDENMPIEAKLLSNSIQSAQARIEGMHFEMRKNVLKYDDVMNRQREIIYSQRRRVLDGESVSDSIRKMMQEYITASVQQYLVDEKNHEEWNLDGLRDRFMGWITDENDLRYSLEELRGMSRDDIAQTLLEKAEARYEAQRQLFGESFEEIERVVLLRNVDTLWMDHIDAMEELKRGIGLRGYAQQDPVVAYRLEGFEMFDQMIEGIKENTVKMLLTIRPRPQVEIKREQTLKPLATGEDGTVKKIPMKADKKKPGRNDPCPCGSGLKYKKCCGK